MDFDAGEDADGVRLSWNCLPASALVHLRNVVPLGAMYTPLNNKAPTPVLVLPRDHLALCRQCKCAINPFSPVTNDTWQCLFCSFLNRLPVISNTVVLPPGLDPLCSTVEYLVNPTPSLPPIFLLVVDTCFFDEDVTDSFAALRAAVAESLAFMPENALVGLVSFGHHVLVHDLIDACTIAFNGKKDYSQEAVLSMLGFLALDAAKGTLRVNSHRFLQPIGQAQSYLELVLDSLQPNTFPHRKYSERPLRATGTALSIASLLLTAVLGSQVQTTGGQLLCFIGGEGTVGPGKIVSSELKAPLRSHHDIVKAQHTNIPSASLLTDKTTKADNSLFRASKKFFQQIALRLVSAGLTCNLFIGCYDQVGLYEMEECCAKTGGIVVMCDLFSTAIFKQSLLRYFSVAPVIEYLPDGQELERQYLEKGFNATLECRTTRDLAVQGLIGNATAVPMRADKSSGLVSATVIGEGATNLWKLGTIDPHSTFAIYLEKKDSSSPHSYVQFHTYYQHPSGEARLRITTCQQSIVPDADPLGLEYGFDQEAALVLMARHAIDQLLPNGNMASPQSVTKQLDEKLVSFCARFAQYIAESVDSFRLLLTYAMLPQFLFHLRRLPFIQVFNNSPDESSFVRHVLMHEDVGNSLLMIQPLLLLYDINTFGLPDPVTGEVIEAPEPVLLDSLSLGPTKILLLDTFFHVLIYHGLQVRDWKQAGYHENEEYAHFRDFLEAPKCEARDILLERFPLPRYIDCDEGGSQARFLMAKLNPSTTYSRNVSSAIYHVPDLSNSVLTDDISLQLFMEEVKKKVVLSKKAKN